MVLKKIIKRITFLILILVIAVAVLAGLKSDLRNQIIAYFYIVKNEKPPISKSDIHSDLSFLTPKEQAWLKEHPVITFAPRPYRPPIEFFNRNNEYSGIASEYIRLLEKKLGVSFKFVNYNDLDSTLKAIKDKKLDVIGAIAATPDRFQYIDFSNPYLELTPVIVTRKNKPGGLTLSSLGGMRVVIVGDYAIADYIRQNYPNIDLHYVPNVYEGLSMLSFGSVDAMILDMAEATYCIAAEEITNLKVSGRTDYVDRICIGVRKDWPVFVRILNKAMNSISTEEKAKIIDQWTSFGYNQPRYGKNFWISVFITSIIIIIVFITILLWNLALKKLVKSRTQDLMRELKERQKAEEKIKKYRDHLEDQVKIRTASLEDANKKLTVEVNERKKIQHELNNAKEVAETANKAKSIFLANMSHEIRTPMNAILGFTQLMCRDSSIEKRHLQNLEIINRSGEHLLELIDQILEMSKIETGSIALNLKTFDLFSLINDLTSMFEPKVREKHIAFESDIANNVYRYIKTDEGKLRQILINIISNAIKFTKEGFIKLKVRQIAVPVKGRIKLKFSVTDSGLGIADSERGKLFTLFGQTEAGINSRVGSGLGLVISQKYVNLMGGEIKVKSKLKTGTMFYFTIIVEESEQTGLISDDKTRHISRLKKGEPTYKILIVEDEKLNITLLSTLLIQVGFDVKIAENGLAGVRLWEEFKPDIILMDLRMPVMDGYEATRKIRMSGKENCDVPIIAITASVFKEEQAKVIAAGCNELIRKPFNVDFLLNIIKKYLGVKYDYIDNKLLHTRDDLKENEKNKYKDILSKLPEDFRTKFKNAIMHADIDMIEELIEEVSRLDKQYYHKLQQALNDFDYDLLLYLLDINKDF